MKTKMIFAALFFAFFAMTNVASAANQTEMPKAEVVNLLDLNVDQNLTDVVLDVELSGDFEIVACTLEGTLTVTTESGDSVTIEFKVTGDDCKEVARTFQNIMSAFE